MNQATNNPVFNLTTPIDIPADLNREAREADDHAWIEVIHRMEDIYTDLVHYQVELEEKNGQLEEAQSFIQSIISSMSEILIVCDINGRIQQVNEALLENLSFDNDLLVGHSLVSIFAEEHKTMVSDFPDHIRSGAIVDCEMDLIDSQQQRVPMALNCSARFDHNDRLSGLVITGRPLGELRKAYDSLHEAHEELKTAQQHLIQSEKMASLGRLVAGVAHELNNPISFLYANMHALGGYREKFVQYFDAIHSGAATKQREELRKALKIDHMLRDIGPLIEGSLEGAERVSDIVQNLRSFTTPQHTAREQFDLVKVAQRASNWVLKASSFRVAVHKNFPEHCLLTNYEGYVHQILVNLIQNALDAMEQVSQAELTMAIEVNGDSVDVTIRDNGPGITEADLLKIFDPFFTTKAVGSGTGLGLYISYGLATEQCGGNLAVRVCDGGGAEFTLSLPVDGQHE